MSHSHIQHSGRCAATLYVVLVTAFSVVSRGIRYVWPACAAVGRSCNNVVEKAVDDDVWDRGNWMTPLYSLMASNE
jgi:hypothetical protein